MAVLGVRCHWDDATEARVALARLPVRSFLAGSPTSSVSFGRRWTVEVVVRLCAHTRQEALVEKVDLVLRSTLAPGPLV